MCKNHYIEDLSKLSTFFKLNCNQILQRYTCQLWSTVTKEHIHIQKFQFNWRQYVGAMNFVSTL
jgi:hypothetical protein